MAEKPKKKVVRVPSTESDGSKKTGGSKAASWTPTPEAKSKATRFRVIAWILWILAIAAEAYLIFVELSKNEPNMTFVYVGIGVIAVLAFVGNILWKKSNQLDPAKRSEPFKFFVQNQLGAIVTMIAFLPLIFFILTNKNLEQKDKTIATVVAGVAFLAVFFGSGITYDSPSVEKQALLIEELKGENLVSWVEGGSVYHICSDVDDVNRESADGTIYEGTVGKAHDEGKERLTLEVESELIACGYEVPENIGEIVQQVRNQKAELEAEKAGLDINDVEDVTEDELEPAN